MSYKQFIQELEDDILPAEAERRYMHTLFPCRQGANIFPFPFILTSCIDLVDTRNTDRSIFQLRRGPTLMPTKMKIGRFHCSAKFSVLVSFFTLWF